MGGFLTQHNPRTLAQLNALIQDADLVASSEILSAVTPPGKCKVTNLYVDPDTGRLVVEYNDTPME